MIVVFRPSPFFLASAPAPRFTQVLLSAFLERTEVWANLTFHVKSWKADEKKVLAKVPYRRYSE